MKGLVQKIIGRKAFIRLEAFKKKIFPTAYDRQLSQAFELQCSFYAEFIKPGDLCFDVGGNVGEKTAVFLKLRGRVVALEPQRRCVSYLKKRFGNRAVILQKGAGAVNETRDFFIADNSVLSSFESSWVSNLENTRFSGRKIEAVERIEIVTLDSLIDEFGKPAFIKIDVEGFELQVLNGLSKPFQCLSFEYISERIPLAVEAVRYLLTTYSGLQFNYSAGNIGALALNDWMTEKDFLTFIQCDFFLESSEGDIYVRNENFGMAITSKE